MPSRKTHVPVGVAAGAATAAYRARNEDPVGLVLEATGGAIGGLIGALAPDQIEPAGWYHRQFFHSWGLFLGGLAAAEAVVASWERFCRDQADQAARDATQPNLTDLQRLALSFIQLAWRIAAGVLSGLLGGYASHLLLDARTPTSLPLIGTRTFSAV